MYVAAETDAQRVLGIIPPPSQSTARPTTVRDVRTAFRRAARGAHPDRPGGDSARFASLVRARELLTTVPDFAPRGEDRIVPVDVCLRDVCVGRVLRVVVTRSALVHRDTGVPLDPRDVWRAAARLPRYVATDGTDGTDWTDMADAADAGRFERRTVETPVDLSLASGVPPGGAWRVEDSTSHVPGLVPGALVCPCRVRPDPVFVLDPVRGDLRIRLDATPVDMIAGLAHVVVHPDGRRLLLRTEPGALLLLLPGVPHGETCADSGAHHRPVPTTTTAAMVTHRAPGYGAAGEGSDLVVEVRVRGCGDEAWPSTDAGVESLCAALSARVARTRVDVDGYVEGGDPTDATDDDDDDDAVHRPQQPNEAHAHVVWLRPVPRVAPSASRPLPHTTPNPARRRDQYGDHACDRVNYCPPSPLLHHRGLHHDDDHTRDDGAGVRARRPQCAQQ